MDSSIFDLTSIVTIIFELTGTEIVVHKQVLCAHCAFAEVCLQERFKEAGEGRILLREEEEEESVRMLIAWMYHGKAMLPTLSGRDDSSNAKEVLPTLALKTTKLYITADKYVMTNFKKEIMLFWTELCRRNTGTSFLLQSLEYLLTKSPPNCELKQLLMDRLVQNIRCEQARGSKSFFVQNPSAPFNKEFFTLTFNHPVVASIILQRVLQPDIQTAPDTQPRSKKPHLEDDQSSRVDPLERSMTKEFLSPTHATESLVSIQYPQTHQDQHRETREYNSPIDSEKKKPEKTVRFAEDAPLDPPPPLPRPQKSFSLPESRSREEEIQSTRMSQADCYRPSEHRVRPHRRERGSIKKRRLEDDESENSIPRGPRGWVGRRRAS